MKFLCWKYRFSEVQFFMLCTVKRMYYFIIMLTKQQVNIETIKQLDFLYKRIQGKAAIVCLKEGTEAIGQFFSEGTFTFNLGNRYVKMELGSVLSRKCLVQTWNSMFKYRIRRWIPLNSENYQRYKAMEGISEKISFLESILIANLLSFSKGIGVYVEKEIQCKLTSLYDPFLVKNKGIKLMAFDIEFVTNMSLPDYIGIGKNASIGYGVVTHVRNETIMINK